MIRSAEHGENWFGGVYREIEQDRRLAFTFTWENEGPSAGVETLVTITFEERDGKTLQTFHQKPFRNVERRDSHVGGWTQAFAPRQTYLPVGLWDEWAGMDVRPGSSFNMQFKRRGEP